MQLNTNKRSVTLNLKHREGREILLQLVRDADVLVESFAPRVMPSLGLGLRDAPSGESAPRRGLDLELRAERPVPGLQDERDHRRTRSAGRWQPPGFPHREPVKLALTVMQIYAGMVCATAITGAYLGSKWHGTGQQVDLALFQMMATNQDRALMATAAVSVSRPDGAAFRRATGSISPRRARIPVPTVTCRCSPWYRAGRRCAI